MAATGCGGNSLFRDRPLGKTSGRDRRLCHEGRPKTSRGSPHHPRATHGWTWDTIVRLQLRASKSLTTVSPVLEAQRSESVDVSTAFVRRRLTRAVRAGTFSAVIGPPSIDMPLVVAIEPLFVTRGDAARLLSLSTVELDKLRASGRIVARRYGRRVLFPIDELRRFAESLPADELGA